MFKRIISTITATMLLLTTSILTASATSVNPSYSEYTDENDAVIRTLVRTPQTSASEVEQYAQIRSDLLRLGMEESALELLTKEELEQYSASDKITTSVTYAKITPDGKTEYVTEDEALRAVAALEEENPVQDQKENGYVRVWHSVTHNGGADYTFATAIRYLQMPYTRGVDAFGSLASYCSLVSYTGSGRYAYTKEKLDLNGNILSSTEKKGSFTDEQIDDGDGAGIDNFCAAGVTYNLPNDVVNEQTGVTLERNRDYNAYFSFDGKIENESDIQNFNSKATLIHVDVVFSFFPDLTVTGTDIGATLDIALSVVRSKLSVMVLVHYEP